MVFKDYIFHNIIGTGKHGVVYKATNIHTNREFAIKRVPNDTKRELQIQNEIINQGKLNSYHIAKLYQVVYYKHDIFMIQELLGADLYTLSRNYILTDCDHKVFIEQILKALIECHMNNISYGDLKMMNVCTKGNHNISLVDFGLSQVCPYHSSGLYKVRGTPAFMAPEIYYGEYGFGIDIWALGIMAYMFYCKKHPFCDLKSENDIREDMENKPLVFPKNICITDDCKDFISLCLERDPLYRSTSFQLIHHPFIQGIY